jgi:Na+-transporting NADH:ubiquinone oxidoreductase subunit NqrC
VKAEILKEEGKTHHGDTPAFGEASPLWGGEFTEKTEYEISHTEETKVTKGRRDGEKAEKLKR